MVESVIAFVVGGVITYVGAWMVNAKKGVVKALSIVPLVVGIVLMLNILSASQEMIVGVIAVVVLAWGVALASTGSLALVVVGGIGMIAGVLAVIDVLRDIPTITSWWDTTVYYLEAVWNRAFK